MRVRSTLRAGVCVGVQRPGTRVCIRDQAGRAGYSRLQLCFLTLALVREMTDCAARLTTPRHRLHGKECMQPPGVRESGPACSGVSGRRGVMFQVCRAGVGCGGGCAEELITAGDLLTTCVQGFGDEASLLTQATPRDIEIPKHVTLGPYCEEEKHA